MTGPWRLRRGDDRAVVEVISYVFMFAIGALVLTFAMDMLVDAQERGQDIAEAKQIEQLGQLTASLTQQAANVAQQAPDATFSTSFAMPDTIRSNGISIEYVVSNTGCPYTAHVAVNGSTDRLNTTVDLGNAPDVTVDGTCLKLSGSVHSSAPSAEIRYDPNPDSSSDPTIVLGPKTQ